MLLEIERFTLFVFVRKFPVTEVILVMTENGPLGEIFMELKDFLTYDFHLIVYFFLQLG